jgi:hypothetical protein
MSDPELSNLIALCAAVFSLIALAISLYEALSNKPKLRTIVSLAAYIPDRKGIVHLDNIRKFRREELPETASIFLTGMVTNFGRQPTTIIGIQFWKGPHFKALNPIPVEVNGAGESLPLKLDPGEIARFFFVADDKIEFIPGQPPVNLIEFIMRDRPFFRIRHSWDEKPKNFRIA